MSDKATRRKPYPRAKTSKERISRCRRATRMMLLRIKGLTIGEIGQEFGISASRVTQILREEIQLELKKRSLAAEELACIELRRLEVAYKAIHQRIVDGDLAAIATGIRLSERIGRLFGLDITREEPSGTMNVLQIKEVVINANGKELPHEPVVDGSTIAPGAKLLPAE